MNKQGLNPYLPSWEYVPDGEPYVFNDRVYVYGSHDRFNGHAFCLNDYVCWSAPVNDLGNWRNEGVIYRKTDDPLNPDGDMCLYAPDVTLGPDGRYYLYYVLDKVPVVSVAVCDTPAGKFEFHGYVQYADGTRLGERDGDEPQFDPGVMTEGQHTYLYTGFCAPGDQSRHGAMATILSSDMLTIMEEPVFVIPSQSYSEGSGYEGHAFFEAPSIRKRGDTYYLVYSSIVMHELCYATSQFPNKGFQYQGVIVSNCDLHIDSYKPADKPMYYGGNNHGSIVEINGDWYIFYHRHTNGDAFNRQGCIEKIFFQEDGRILQVEMTSCGPNGRPLEGKGEYPAYLACNLFTQDDQSYTGGFEQEPGWTAAFRRSPRMVETVMKRLVILPIWLNPQLQDLSILIAKEFAKSQSRCADIVTGYSRSKQHGTAQHWVQSRCILQIIGNPIQPRLLFLMAYRRCILHIGVREVRASLHLF